MIDFEKTPPDVKELLGKRISQLGLKVEGSPVERFVDKLRALFVGDMTFEECEISWIIQSDYKPLLDAFPQLESLRVRGSTSLKFAPFEHSNLQELAIECGGLPSALANDIADSKMPALRNLELWLGDDSYGFNAATEKYEDLVAAGVIDPAKVTRTALQNAASIAGLMLTTEAMIADAPEEKGDGGMGMPGGGMGGMGMGM